MNNLVKGDIVTINNHNYSINDRILIVYGHDSLTIDLTNNVDENSVCKLYLTHITPVYITIYIIIV